jgi:hypothetical protein
MLAICQDFSSGQGLVRGPGIQLSTHCILLQNYGFGVHLTNCYCSFVCVSSSVTFYVTGDSVECYAVWSSCAIPLQITSVLLLNSSVPHYTWKVKE